MRVTINTRVGPAREKGEPPRFMKILVDGDTEEILGAAVPGVDGDEAINCILDTMYAKAPYTVIQAPAHPPHRVGADSNYAR